MNTAFQEMFGIEDGFAKVEFAGRTDLYILHEALSQHGIGGDHLAEFQRRYFDLLPASMRQKTGCLMPGFPALLEALAGRPDVRLGLATGNFSEGARIKLEHFGIRHYFEGGAFGEESMDRSELVRAAIERVAPGAAPEDILVIGDTPHDVASALDNGVMAIAVATGKHTAEELRDSGAHAVFPDFGDWRATVRVLAGA